MWKPVDAEFYIPHLPVSIVGLSGSTEATRLMLESLNCIVLTHKPGTPTDFLKVLSQGGSAPRYMIIQGHGTTEGIWFGQFGPPNIDTSMLNGEYLPPEVIKEHVHLPGCTVLGVFCSSAHKPMAEAFLAGGIADYIGCPVGWGGLPMGVFLTNFLYQALHKQLSNRDAWRKAVEFSDDEVIRQLSYFHADGTEENL